jgi:hypothetical protein
MPARYEMQTRGRMMTISLAHSAQKIPENVKIFGAQILMLSQLGTEDAAWAWGGKGRDSYASYPDSLACVRRGFWSWIWDACLAVA